MHSDDEWAEMSLRDFQTALASSSPTPGGGTAAAVSLGQAAALTCMVADLTIGKEKWSAGWTDAEKAQEVAISMFSRALDLATDDSRAFDAVMMAYKLPKGEDEAIMIRNQAIEQATLGAAEIPLQTARLAFSLLKTLPALAKTGNGNAVTDVGVAALLSSAACKGALFNVDINLTGMEGEIAKGYTNEASEILVASRQLSRECMDAVRARLNS
ncbi:MAG: cyclodeaminase/cyclohydrolase family protein [Candidatus Poseidoniaceae archaeon]|jgi:formiminotetrahydrofolate cyclodeaminase|nr:cyclodeaminase/cyclohydrolase family protein [Candidatus Poseidoniaceae archaeon]|tara:strand:+ start:759 stop:1400 length:642 start_codon:yes stop_codon:yes gene_type:complete